MKNKAIRKAAARPYVQPKPAKVRKAKGGCNCGKR